MQDPRKNQHDHTVAEGIAALTESQSPRMIINIPDAVIGSWHQVTLEESFNPRDPAIVLVRLDGDAVSPHHQFARDVVRLWLSWSDSFEGVADKDAHILDATP